jgi:predicted porin
LLLAVGVAQAQTSNMPGASAGNPAPVDNSLTWHGITLYGIVDVGLQYDSHAVPFSDYFPGGSADIVQKNSNKSVFGVTPSNLSQSRVGLQGKEPFGLGDWSGVFKLETFFNPQSGEISDALKSLTQNNGKPLAAQNTNLDSSVAGQAFQQSFAGVSSATFGTLTFGRQNTTFADGISKYDPNAASQAFSVIGLSGTAAGGGDTEDRRFDDSLKYSAKYFDLVHVGAIAKLANGSAASWRAGGGSGEAYSAFELQLGADYAGLSVDVYYNKIKDAIAAAALSATQVTELPAGYSLSNSLAGTVSDNETWAIMALYDFGGPKVYAGFEHIAFSNPSIPLLPGFNMIGGYVLAAPNNTAYEKGSKTLEVYWAGVKYPLNEHLDITAAYYGYKQDAYASGADAGCSSTVSGACSGNLNAYSVMADYRLTKRFDVYGGMMYSKVSDGLAAGYLETNNVNPTIGVRFTF